MPTRITTPVYKNRSIHGLPMVTSRMNLRFVIVIRYFVICYCCSKSCDLVYVFTLFGTFGRWNTRNNHQTHKLPAFKMLFNFLNHNDAVFWSKYGGVNLLRVEIRTFMGVVNMSLGSITHHQSVDLNVRKVKRHFSYVRKGRENTSLYLFFKYWKFNH